MRLDGLSSGLFNHFAKLLPNLVLGAMQKINLIGDKPYKLSKRFLIFINKPNSNKRCHKRLRPITLISNLLKITSREVSKRIEYSIVNSNIMTRAQFAYFRDKSDDEIIRYIEDIIADSNVDVNLDQSFLILCSDYSSAFDNEHRDTYLMS